MSKANSLANAKLQWNNDTPGSRRIFLLDARNSLEHRLLQDWVQQSRPEGVSISDIRFCNAITPQEVNALLDKGDLTDTDFLQALRVVWLPRYKAGEAGLFVKFMSSIGLEPGWLRQRLIAHRSPERVCYVAGDGASLAQVKARLKEQEPELGENTSVAEFVVRQALISLERAERIARGARYKIAKLLTRDVFANKAFRQNLKEIAQETGTTYPAVHEEAQSYLREMAAMQTPFTLDFVTNLYRSVCRANHDPEIDVLPEQLDKVRQRMHKQPVVFLISHKSMLDTAAFSLVLYDADLPLPLTFGGINLNTPGVGALVRRAGIIFLRRSFQDNPVYKSTFRRYIDYLIDKRFSLLWALEGTRSRTGKLLPPRFGLFNYVLDSVQRTSNLNTAFIPVSVAYDQITEVADYSREQMGHDKKPEGSGWMLRFFKRGTSHGKIFLRFGKAVEAGDIVSMSSLNAGLDEQQKQALVQGMAFQVAVNMNQATPITTSAIVTLILLAGGRRAQTFSEIQTLARTGAAMIRRRKLEIVGQSDFKQDKQLQATLEQLCQTGIVTVHKDGVEPLYAVAEAQHHKAAYYRNTAIHYFVLDAIAELALQMSAPKGNAATKFVIHAFAMRELFKFEFYFPSRRDFESELRARCDQRFAGWELALRDGSQALQRLLGDTAPLLSHGVLRAFVDAYRTVAETLILYGDDPIPEKAAFIEHCLKLGRQLQLQGEVFSVESVSKSLFETGLKLASHRDLHESGQAQFREDFLHELKEMGDALDQILNLTLSQARQRQ